MDTSELLNGYDIKNITVGVLGGHSALDVCHGARKYGFKNVCTAREGREKTYERYFRARDKTQNTNHKTQINSKFQIPNSKPRYEILDTRYSKGCVDQIIKVKQFQDILKPEIQKKLRELNTVFVHNRYFWVYFDDFSKIENDFSVPIFGSRHLLRLEERDQHFTQYDLLKIAGIRTPKIFISAQDIDRPVLVKANEAKRGYERAFFVAGNESSYESEGKRLEEEGKIASDWRSAPIEEFVVGAHVNFNFFYSPLSGELELMGTDTRRQTNLDGFLRMLAPQQKHALEFGISPKMIETGHIAVTVKESILEKAFELGEKFVSACGDLTPEIDPSQKGIIGPFALQGAVVAEDGKEDIVIFDVSFRIPGSPGTFATPYTRYLYGESISVGERIGMELRRAVLEGRVEEVVT